MRLRSGYGGWCMEDIASPSTSAFGFCSFLVVKYDSLARTSCDSTTTTFESTEHG